MALIKCPNCNADISDKAERCPKCGFESVSKGISEPRIINKERIDNNKKDTIVITKRSLIIACLTLSFVFILIVVAGIVIYDQINRSRMVNEELNVSMMLEQEDYHYSTVADTNGDMEENGNIQNQSNFANDNASISATVTATEPSPSDKEEQDVGLGKKNALEKAQELLKYSSYSYEGLIDSLEYYEFTEEEAKYGADWYEQALNKAQELLKYSSYSYEGLIDSLEYYEFTEEEAKYGADNCGADWYEQALNKAQELLKYSSYSYEGLIDSLEYYKFTEEEAKYGADNCGADWYEQALNKAQELLKYSSYSYEGLIDSLEYYEFTEEEAKYGADNCGENWN